MCGYCTEETAFEILSSDVRGNLQMKDLGCDMYRYFYLREASDFNIALDRLRRSLAHKRLPFFEEVPHIVVLYRGLEILLEQGFSSPAYQSLLKQPLYRDAIAATCSDENRRLFEAATEGLKIEHLGLLYDAETYFWGERSKQLRTLADVLPSCRNLLKHYINWWLEEEKLEVSSSDKTMKETDEYESSNDVADNDRARFTLLSRAIYFSILTVGSCSAGKKMLLAIIQRHPVGGPFMDGNDLWMQCVAALKLFDLEGFEAFSKHLTTVRDGHYYYVDLIRSFSFEQRQMLLSEVTQQGSKRLARWLPHDLPGPAQ